MHDLADSTSTRPYLIRALHEWCTDNGFTPFLSVQVDNTVRVPLEFVRDGEIVLNISFDATSALQMGNDCIEFKGRFGGVARDILVPVARVMAIYARENGQGMAFPMESPSAAPVSAESSAPTIVSRSEAALSDREAEQTQDPNRPVPPGSPSGRPALKRIK